MANHSVVMDATPGKRDYIIDAGCGAFQKNLYDQNVVSELNVSLQLTRL